MTPIGKVPWSFRPTTPQENKSGINCSQNPSNCQDLNPDSPLPLPGPIGFSEISSALRQASKVFFSEIAPLKDKFLLSLQLQQFRGSVAELRSEVEARPNLLDRLAGFRDLSDRSQGFLHSSRKHDLRSLQDPHELIQTLQAWHRSLLLPGVPVSRAAEDLALIVRFAEGEKQNPQLAKWLQGQLRDTVAGFNNRLMKAKDYAGAHRLLNSVNRNFGGAFDGPLQDVCQRLIGQALELENDLSTLNPSQKLKALCQLASVYRQLRENPEEALAKHEERYRGILEEIVELGKDPSLSDGEKIDAMMLAASKREFDVLLFWKLDRLSREGADRVRPDERGHQQRDGQRFARLRRAGDCDRYQQRCSRLSSLCHADECDRGRDPQRRDRH